MTESTPNEIQFNRRKFLQNTGVAAGLGLAGLGTAAATEDTLGETIYVEVGVVHDVSLPEPVNGKLPLIHTDVPLGHYVDTEQGRVYLLEAAPDNAVETFRGQATAFTPGGYASLPTTTLGEETKWVITETERSFRPVEVLTVERPYQSPTVDLDISGDTVNIRSSGTSSRIVPGEEGSLELQPHSLPIKIESQVGDREDVRHIPERMRSIKTKSHRETVTTTPALKVRNYGPLEVVNALDRVVP